MDTKKDTYKIAMPSLGVTANSLVSNSFGRCPFIIIYDKEDKKYQTFKNTGAKVQDGSGLKAAEILIRNNVTVLLTIEIGRKAYSVLSKEHIDVSLLKSTGTIKSLINKFINKG
jgi:predicted Fe-Mo cluster-binding NifX family protein